MGTNKKLAHKPSKSQNLNQIYSRPLKEGTGLAPTWSQEHYRGIPLHPDVKRRLDEYAALKSYMPPDRTWSVVVGEPSQIMSAPLDTEPLQEIAGMMR